MDKITCQVEKYYSSKLEQFGTTPKGVDWNSIESQNLRFEILSKVIMSNNPFSILDFGCGFGSMFAFLENSFEHFTYTGFDISNDMIRAAKANFHSKKNAYWTPELPSMKHDFVVASGIFNVKLANGDTVWLNYILDTLKQIDQLASKGFSFNVLTSYSDKEFMRAELYYADPLFLFDFCKKHFSKNVALLHDYNLYEFSIIVRKK
jgi:SAM-dependent methyltransferase